MSNFLRAAFSALPHVVGDTRALIAYVVAVAGWVAVALKVQRNRNLLFHLRKLPEKDRLQALQMEMGAIPVPAGMTPTQYLTARVHRYYFWAFVILCVLLGAIGALAISYRSPGATEISQGFEHALEAERQKIAANAPNVRIQEAQTRIEALQLRRIPEYYVQEFGEPADKGRTAELFTSPFGNDYSGWTYLVWLNDIYELDINFMDGRSIEYCVVSENKDFKPRVPEPADSPESIHLGEHALAQLADTYVWANFGSGGGSIVARYGFNGSHADDNLFGYVAYAASPAEYPQIRGADQLPQLKPANSEAVGPSEAVGSPMGGEDPINAFAVSTLPQPNGPVCLQLHGSSMVRD